jgi:broad specificity phosphatase PhoE/ribonuclease HI
MRVRIEADGGSRGNPGPAGFGAVVFDAATGDVLAERAEAIGVATNNVAEYRGLIAGLEAALALGADGVEVRMDSKLVVEQMAGRWQVKHPSMRPLAAEARALAARFTDISYSWIPRAQNSHADRLANAAMDGSPINETANGAAQPAGSEPAHRSDPTAWTGATGEPTRLLLVRHGQTPLSVERRYSGRGDAELTDLGRAQAAAAARRLAKVDGVGPTTPILASPLARAAATARAVAEASGGAVTGEDAFIETDFGGWEGLTFTEASQRDPELHSRWLSDPSVPAPGGESFDEVHARVGGALADVLERHSGRTVIVVSHVTPIKALLRIGLDAGPSLLFRLHLDLASLSVVEFYPDGNATVRLVNDVSHLG